MLKIKKVCQEGKDRYQLIRKNTELGTFASRAYAIRKAKSIMAETKEWILLEHQGIWGMYMLADDGNLVSTHEEELKRVQKLKQVLSKIEKSIEFQSSKTESKSKMVKKALSKKCKMPRLLVLAAALGMAVPSLANTMNFNELAQQCSKGTGLHPNTLQAVARVESQFNPYVIGVVRGRLQRQPRNLAEAIATAKSLHAQGKNFSMGLMQVNRYNLNAYGLNYETVFDPCKNINAGARILKDCFDRAGGNDQSALKKAFSCYYSGNFTTGFKVDFKGQPPYVTKVVLAAMDNSPNQQIGVGVSSGSLKTSRQTTRQATLLHTSYAASQQNQSSSNGYIPMPNQQNPQNSAPQTTETPQEAVKVTATAQRKRAEWDIFQEF